jgi:mycofactocin biosynthesis protein MftB
VRRVLTAVRAPSQTVPSRAGRIDTASAWRLHPSVAVRPEPFGALLYHYGTRRLTFVKDLTLQRLLTSLATAESVDAALASCGIGADQAPRYIAALERLAGNDMLRRDTGEDLS